MRQRMPVYPDVSGIRRDRARDNAQQAGFAACRKCTHERGPRPDPASGFWPCPIRYIRRTHDPKNQSNSDPLARRRGQCDSDIRPDLAAFQAWHAALRRQPAIGDQRLDGRACHTLPALHQALRAGDVVARRPGRVLLDPHLRRRRPRTCAGVRTVWPGRAAELDHHRRPIPAFLHRDADEPDAGRGQHRQRKAVSPGEQGDAVMLTGFTFYHYWMVAGYALLFVAVHLLLVLAALRYAGRRTPAWPLGAGAAMLAMAIAGLSFGNMQRGGLAAGLEQRIGPELGGVCRQAEQLIVDMGGEASPDDEPLREKIQQALRAHFSQSARQRFEDDRFAPASVVESGQNPKWGDLVIALRTHGAGRDPVHVGCYNQYEHRYSGFSGATKPYWRWDADPIPFENIVFFRQDPRSQPVVSYEAAGQ
ncbi:hypothetical protein G6F35_009477 [Rhizopus arrhizus]|nr:hypothetical protein G6F35_009477 [Rhizopus arrhizus]